MSTATKLDNMVSYLDGLPPIKVALPFDHVVLWDQVTNWNHYVSTNTALWSQNLASKWLSMKSFHPYCYSTLWSSGLARSCFKVKTSISPLPQYLWPKNLAGWWLSLTAFLPIKSNDHKITWSCKIAWQTKVIIYPLTHCLWLSILAGWG